MVAYRFAALAATFASAQAAYKGFNAGSTNIDGSVRQQSDFEAEFSAGANLPKTNGEWTSARLYTMIQAGTANDPISAIPAAISTDTSLLLGLWGSAGDDAFNQELTALRSAISTYGSQLADHAIGISVGSEDLYRITPTGIANKAGVGAGPDVIARYIKEVKDITKGTALANVPVGHVDTWTAWVNGSNSAVIDASDFLGVDGYPYFQTDSGDNSIDNAKNLFFDSYDATVGVSGGKPVWVTETGWPIAGPKVGQAVASVENAKTYWDEVQCTLASQNVNTFWFTLQDSNAADTATFGILEDGFNSAPKYDLSCSNSSNGSKSSSSAVQSKTSAPSSTKAAHSVGGAGSYSASASASASGSAVVPSSVASTGRFVPGFATGSALSGSSAVFTLSRSATSAPSAPSATGVPGSVPAPVGSGGPSTAPSVTGAVPTASPSPFTGAASTVGGQSAFALAAAAVAALFL